MRNVQTTNVRILLLFFIKFQISRLERKLAEVEEQLHSEMTAKDELESAHRTTSVKLAKLTEELSEEVGFLAMQKTRVNTKLISL